MALFALAGEDIMRTEISRRLEEIRADKGDMVAVGDIAEIVDGILKSLSGDLTGGDLRLYHEIQSLASYIDAAKSEIASIRPQDIAEEHIAIATDELDAIVQHTEEATGAILDAAEKLEAIADGIDDANATALRDAVTMIYESCNFQDITGQRITRIVRALKDIDGKVMSIIEAFGGEGIVHDPDRKKAGDEKKPEAAKLGDKDLLNGPQLPDAAQSQDDIDALFASLK